MSPLDLHVLGTPPAFVLSQDQTLPFNPSNTLVSKLFGIFAEFLARFSLYRFQGSLRSFPRFRSGELDYNTKAPPPCQALFYKFLSQKKPVSVKVFQGFRTSSTSCGQATDRPATFGGHFRFSLLEYFILYMEGTDPDEEKRLPDPDRG